MIGLLLGCVVALWGGHHDKASEPTLLRDRLKVDVGYLVLPEDVFVGDHAQNKKPQLARLERVNVLLSEKKPGLPVLRQPKECGGVDIDAGANGCSSVEFDFVVGERFGQRKTRAGECYSHTRDGNLNFIQEDCIFCRFRHAPLFAQIGLVMALCFTAFQAIPVGFDFLFPLHTNGGSDGDRKWWLGTLLSLLGWGSLGLLLAVILSV